MPMQHNVAWVKAYLPTKGHLDPSSQLARTDMGRKLGGAVPLLGHRQDTQWSNRIGQTVL